VQDLEDLYKLLDHDGDGKVDFNEFHNAIRALGCLVVDGVAENESDATRLQQWRRRVW
jgi:Ca2+-binding EF-hand superfamily protein